MISILRRYQKPLFLAVIAIFLIGTFVGLGGYFFTSRDMSGTVATVGSTKIPYSLFAAKVNQYLDAIRGQGAELKEDQIKEIKQLILRDMIVDEILLSKAEEMGLQATDEEVSYEIQHTKAFQHEGTFNQDLYFQALRRVLHETPRAYEDSRRKAIKVAKLKQILYLTAKLPPEELRGAYAQANKGSLKDFEKEKESFAAKLQQQRALELINYYLRQISAQVEIRSYLEQRDSGV
ncbi:MAG: SurA N-terminal domain-containing protein [Elusimicrobia bacterium]|nr:SurA N-terminal domain-containing protein [Elusimicrobiota bacterium]